ACVSSSRSPASPTSRRRTSHGWGRRGSSTTSTPSRPTTTDMEPGMEPPRPPLALRESHSFPRHVIDQIHGMAEEGRYEIRGWGAKRALPTFDDLVFVTASASRYPIEGYRETCATTTVLGSRHASRPLVLDIPITIAGMSFGALSGRAKEALGRALPGGGPPPTT